MIFFYFLVLFLLCNFSSHLIKKKTYNHWYHIRLQIWGEHQSNNLPIFIVKRPLFYLKNICQWLSLTCFKIVSLVHYNIIIIYAWTLKKFKLIILFQWLLDKTVSFCVLLLGLFNAGMYNALLEKWINTPKFNLIILTF